MNNFNNSFIHRSHCGNRYALKLLKVKNEMIVNIQCPNDSVHAKVHYYSHQYKHKNEIRDLLCVQKSLQVFVSVGFLFLFLSFCSFLFHHLQLVFINLISGIGPELNCAYSNVLMIHLNSKSNMHAPRASAERASKCGPAKYKIKIIINKIRHKQ